MGKNPSVIEINGNKYDAKNGRLLSHPRGPVIDGFMRKPQAGRIINKVADTLTLNDAVKDRLRKPAQTVHKRTERSKTLMRSAVAKPSSSKAEDGKKQSSKLRISAVKPSRLSRAINATKSSQVNRFGESGTRAKSILSQAVSRSKSPAGDGPRLAATTAAVAVAPTPSVVRSVSQQKLERMLDEALLRADAHKKGLANHTGKRRFSKRPSWLPRWAVVSAVTLVLLGLGTYFAWQNVPYVSTKMASVRAKVTGSVPAYVPSGFKFAGPTQYESGAISMTFKSEEESRYFTLIQKASNWDSSSLEANTLSNDSQVQTSQVKGTTVYYSGDQATWVTNGKRYIIKDHAQLNPGELFKIADSIF